MNVLTLRVQSRWTDVDGPVHYGEWPGPSKGPVFVCVHGLGGSLLNWAQVGPRLAERGRVLALDLSGFGMTPPAGRGSGVGSNRLLLDGFLRALRLPPVILVGNSMGGMIAVIQAAHNPATVERLVLVDAAFPRGRSMAAQPPPRLAAAFALFSSMLGERLLDHRSRRLGPERLVRTTFRISTADPSSIDPRLVEAHIQMVRDRQTQEYAIRAFQEAARSIFRAQARPGRYRALVRAVDRPALVLHGARDRLAPLAAAREAVRGHVNWDLVVFEDLGHLPMMEAPDRFMAAVERWLDGSRPPSGAP